MIPRKLKDGRVVVVEDNAKTKGWRRMVGRAAGVHLPEHADQYQPIRVVLLFAVTRASAQAGLPGPVKRATGGVGGDVDKLARLVLDALEDSGVLKDDAQVVQLEARKVFDDDPDWETPSNWQRRGCGLYCRVEPVGYVPDELPYEQVLDADERADG